jgi:hypothetical protein
MNSIARELPSTQWADEFSSRHQQVVAPKAADEWARDFDSWLSGKQIEAEQNGYVRVMSQKSLKLLTTLILIKRTSCIINSV